MRLTLVIDSLGRGGAERTASTLANSWAARGDHVTLITFASGDVPAYPLHEAIVLRRLELRQGKARHILHGLSRNRKIVRALRAAIAESHPDLIISFMHVPNVLTLLAARGIDAPVMITEHTHPAFHDIGWHWQLLRRLLYRRARALVCMTEDVLSWFQQRTPVKGYVIPNPVSVPPGPAATKSGTEQVVIAMGRLAYEKGFDLLLEAFSRIATHHSGWRLRILGEGSLKHELEAHAQKVNLAGRVEFTGAVSDPFPLLRSADLFILSSRFEGFGNALCEAMACGLPVISFDCPSGPRRIIRHELDGLLVPAEDISALSATMHRLMSDPEERRRLAMHAPEVLTRFGLQRVLGLWDQIFSELRPPSTKAQTSARREVV